MGNALIGPPGSLERIKGSSRLVSSVPERHTYAVTLGGKKRAYRLPRQRRTWDVQVGTAKPEEWSILEQVAHGLLPGPVVWYDEFAQVTNILPPELSLSTGPVWDNAQRGGASSQIFPPDKHRFLRSWQGLPYETMTMPLNIPVPDHCPVVVSAYLTGHADDAAELIVEELDPEGTPVREHQRATDPAQPVERVVIDLVTSYRTVALRIKAHNVLTLASPAVTLTRRAVPWAPGRGCLEAVVDIDQEDVQMAFEATNDWGRRSTYSFTVTEIG